jgi:glycosyltransferase involved in cell wall biosynthesis
VTKKICNLNSIALLTPGVTPYVTGGLQRHSFNLAKFLAAKGVRVDLYHTSFSKGADIDELEGMSAAEHENVTSIAVPWETDQFPGHYVRSLKRFSQFAYKVYRSRPPVDFIIGKSLTAWTFVEAKRQGHEMPPIGVNFHGYEMFQPRPNFRTRLEAAMLRPSFLRNATAADFVFSYGGKISEIIENTMSISRKKIVEIPGGTDPLLHAQHPTNTREKRKFIFVGRYERRKGIEELNAAISCNSDWQSKCEFCFVGAIPPDCRLDLPHVFYCGEIRDAAEIQAQLAGADVLLCPSHSEGMPNVIMEGMAAGLAILATDVGAVPLLVSHRNGIVIPSSNIEAIENAICSFLSMPNESLESMKANSHSHIENFFWPIIADRTIETLSDLVGELCEGGVK